MATEPHNIHQTKLIIEAKVKTLINNDLKEICRAEGVAVSGVKAALQKRILEVLAHHVARHDVKAVERLRFRVNNQGQSPPPESIASASMPPDRATPISPAPNRAMSGYTRPPSLSSYHHPARPTLPPISRINFRPSPFYQVRESLTPLQDMSGAEMPHNRHTFHVNLTLNEHVCSQLREDPSLRIMLYCAQAQHLSPFALNVDIAFPSQIEVRISGDEVKSNFKGLKNKPGTTKPADITDFVRKAPNYTNSVHIIYALTKERYSVLINLVKKTSADELAATLKQNGNRIPKDVVLRDMAKKAEDPDIVATSTVMSLKDPISTMRISLPCRSNVCTHTQCFDGSYFLQLQEQAPTWTCPVCNKTISYASLCVDNYVQDILDNTSSSTEQVVIEPNGKWKAVVQGDDQASSKPQARAAYDNESDDDVIEIQDSPKAEKIKTESNGNLALPPLAQQTPPQSSREASTVAPRTGSKRPSSAVIDLTLSDDDEPPRPPKRNTNQSTSYNTPASLQDGRYADLGSNRPSSILGQGQSQGYQEANRADTLPPVQVPDIHLPPIQAPRPNGGLQNGQRLPWPPGAPLWTNNQHRDSESFSRSPV